MEWGAGVNVLVGDNGSGKTNVLDAIYWLGMGRSRFHRRDALSVRMGAEAAMVEGVAVRDEKERIHRILIPTGGPRRFTIDGETVPSIREYLGAIPLVMMTPSDHDLISGGREVRRRFFDMLFSRLQAAYFQDLLQYHRLLPQRNRILKDYAGRREGRALLEVIDRKMAPLIQRITDYRATAVTGIIDRLRAAHGRLAQRPETASITYEPSIGPDEAPLRALAEAAEKDWHLKTTTRGPHRDHFAFFINDRPIDIASQGQQKTFVLALKMAEWEVLEQVHATSPLLLLDDVFDKLDARRSRRLLQLLGRHGRTQVWITDTAADRARPIVGPDATYYAVSIRDGQSTVRPL